MPLFITYVVHDLNGLDAYTLGTVHEHDSVVATERQVACVLLFACYMTCCMIHTYIAHKCVVGFLGRLN